MARCSIIKEKTLLEIQDQKNMMPVLQDDEIFKVLSLPIFSSVPCKRSILSPVAERIAPT